MKKEYLIQEITKLLIKQDFYDKKHNIDTYVKKTALYRDLIKFIKLL
jgi:hypothetical protein